MASMASMNWSNPFSYLGLAAATYLTWKFTQQAKVYLLPSTLNKRYNASGNNWALVTGATNGIGFGFCEELCERGFNVILHGRNKALLKQRARELAAAYPARKTAIVVLDVVGVTSAVDDVAAQVRAVLAEHGGELSLLVNNVGGETRPYVQLDAYSFEDVQNTIDKNAVFMTHITRVLLPFLGEKGPGAIVNVSSVSSFGMPYVSVYSATKGFVDSFTYALAAECQVERPNVEVLGLRSAQVKTAGFDIQETLFSPSARKMASAALNRIGCGRIIVWAYFWHWVQGISFDILPRWVLIGFSSQKLLALKKEEEENRKTKTM